MSIKTSGEEWVRKGPTQAIAVIAAVGLIVGGVIGLGVGFKLEQSRTKSSVHKLQQELTKQKSAKTGVVVGALGQRVGKVSATSGTSITVATKKRGAQTVETSATTVFENAVSGTIADVHSGQRILVVPGGAEIIVLSANSKLGRVVTKVTNASIKIAKGNGFPEGNIKTTDVHRVETVKPAKISDMTIGKELLVGGRAKDAKTFTAIEVILLPDGSGFAN